jgi:simple sugar transport system permease protein
VGQRAVFTGSLTVSQCGYRVMADGAASPAQAAPAPQDSKEVSRASKRARPRISVELLLVPAIIAVLVIGSFVNNNFLTQENLVNILVASAGLAILVVAETLIIIAGSFDLSLESTTALGPAVCALLVLPAADGGWGLGWWVWAAIGVALLVGPLIGLINGLLIVKLRLNAFIVTLAILIVVRGVQQGLTNSKTLQSLPPETQLLGSATILTVPLSVWLAGALFLIAELMLRYHAWGRAIYAMGGNLEAARLSGIRVDAIRLAVFALAGLLAVIAGFVLLGYVGAIPPNLAKDYLFTVFAATVVGGVSLNGGKGSMIGALSGVLLLGVVQNLMVLAQVPSYWIQAVYGAIILLSLLSARATTGVPQE